MLWGLPSALLLLAGAIPLILFLHSLKPRGLKIATTTMFHLGAGAERATAGHAARLGCCAKTFCSFSNSLPPLALIAALADPSLLLHRPALGRHGRRARLEREHEGQGQKRQRASMACAGNSFR